MGVILVMVVGVGVGVGVILVGLVVVVQLGTLRCAGAIGCVFTNMDVGGRHTTMKIQNNICRKRPVEVLAQWSKRKKCTNMNSGCAKKKTKNKKSKKKTVVAMIVVRMNQKTISPPPPPPALPSRSTKWHGSISVG